MKEFVAMESIQLSLTKTHLVISIPVETKLTSIVTEALKALPQFINPDDPNQPLLTTRQRTIFMDIHHGLTNKEIADKLSISERTVKFHVSSLLYVFGVRSRIDLALLATKFDYSGDKNGSFKPSGKDTKRESFGRFQFK